MAVTITPCTGCPEATTLSFCGEAVFEDDQCLVPGVPSTATVAVTVEPQDFNVELACCGIAVVCGTLQKTIAVTSGGATTTRTFHLPVQVDVKLPDDIDFQEPLTPDNLTIASVDVCSGCFRLLCPTISGGTTVFHDIKEKDILLFEFTFTPTP